MLADTIIKQNEDITDWEDQVLRVWVDDIFKVNDDLNNMPRGAFYGMDSTPCRKITAIEYWKNSKMFIGGLDGSKEYSK